jgi:DNA-directed RNA polymerase specialized sigma54-like protein
MLQEEGIKIARRTVAKYRAIEGILPARLRGTNKLSQAA